ncbi:MAG: tetratricopeptide repeat protein [Moorea sp. SIOASIH]|uniref:tetratricopeptide repeat protein n=1 Tax=Moorena sp. SIOASIH TaxID=2607817 RepID=UPI0013B6D134|nr:tetratricopeptide repeat protein [Moorena sp. SIOASIH]NEO38799.1 tetratricopeptide repeat protein [Moorena sp. SIOASIH]
MGYSSLFGSIIPPPSTSGSNINMAHLVQNLVETEVKQHQNKTAGDDPFQPPARKYRQSQLQNILKTLQNTLAICQTNEDLAGQVDTLKRIGLVHCRLGEYAWGIKCLEQSLQMANDVGSPKSLGVILHHLGMAYSQTNQDDKAFKVYLKALRIFQKTQAHSEIAKILNHLGEIHNSWHQPVLALRCFRQAMKIFQNSGNSIQGEGRALENIGEAYTQLGRYRQALAVLEQALTIHEKKTSSRYSSRKLTTLERIGTVYFRLGEELRALDFYHQALEIGQELSKSLHGNTRSLDYIGAVHYHLGNYPHALAYHLQALRLWQEISHPGQGESLFHEKLEFSQLRTVYNCLGISEQGVQCSQQVQKMIINCGYRVSEEEISQYLSHGGRLNHYLD